MARSQKSKQLQAPADPPDGREETRFSPAAALLGLVAVVFIATRLWMLLGFNVEGSDANVYGEFARQGVDRGKVAYLDFDVYYPPVAWWVIAFPRVMDDRTYAKPEATPATVRQYWQWYFGWFHFEMFLADVVCLSLMWAIGRTISPRAEWGLPAAYTLLTIAQPHLLYDRLDVGLLMFLLLCIYCWLRSLVASPAARGWTVAYGWTAASYLFLGLGISFKVVPLICVPFLLLADLWAWRSAGKFAGLVLSLVVGGLGPFLVHMPSAGWSVFSLFGFHAERETHLESIWSSIMLVARAKFGVPSYVIHSHGGYNLTGEWSDTVKTVASATMLAMAASFGLWAVLRGGRYDRRLALDSAELLLFNSMVLSIVFSPQYLIWALPLALLLAVNIFPRSRTPWCAFAVLVVAILGISSWLFPYHYDALIDRRNLAIALSITRSACLVALALLLSICFFARYGLVPWRAAKAAPEALALGG